MPSADRNLDTSISIDNSFLILYPDYQNYPLPNISTTSFMPLEHQAGATPPSPSNPPSLTSSPQQEPSSQSLNPGAPLSPAQSSLLTLNTRLPTVPTPPTLPQKLIGVCCVPYLNLRKRAKSSPAKGLQFPPTPPPAGSEATPPIGTSSPEDLTATRISSYESFPPPSFDLNGQPRALDSRLYPEEATTSSPSSAHAAQTGTRANETPPRIVPNFSRPRHRNSITSGDHRSPAPTTAPTTTTPPTRPPSPPAAAPSAERNNIPPIPAHLTHSLSQRPDTTRKRCHYRRPSCRARIPPKSPKSPHPPSHPHSH